MMYDKNGVFFGDRHNEVCRHCSKRQEKDTLDSHKKVALLQQECHLLDDARLSGSCLLRESKNACVNDIQKGREVDSGSASYFFQKYIFNRI